MCINIFIALTGGKPITPTEDHVIGNGKTQKNDTSNGKMVLEEATKTNVSYYLIWLLFDGLRYGNNWAGIAKSIRTKWYCV